LLIKEGFNIQNKIVLCRYGFTFRGNKVKNAEKYGVSGVLLFDDPMRAAPPEARDKIYPNGDFLPPEGVQRGSLNYKEGDPSTPVYPSTSKNDKFVKKPK
jgi:N-acetylated-alpha-linked acidic dipeptidase